jgi:hypothetical protein
MILKKKFLEVRFLEMTFPGSKFPCCIASLLFQKNNIRLCICNAINQSTQIGLWAVDQPFSLTLSHFLSKTKEKWSKYRFCFKFLIQFAPQKIILDRRLDVPAINNYLRFDIFCGILSMSGF